MVSSLYTTYHVVVVLERAQQRPSHPRRSRFNVPVKARPVSRSHAPAFPAYLPSWFAGSAQSEGDSREETREVAHHRVDGRTVKEG